MMARALPSLLVASFLTSCVLTTNEGPTEPPRGAIQPIWPPLGEIPTQPIEGEPAGEEGKPGATHTAGRPETIGARHILVMHRLSMRVPQGITRTKEEAKARAEEALKRAKAGEDFVKLVVEYSDEPNAKQRGGYLGRFPHGVMVKAFEEAAFALEPGQISELVETPFGFHVIQRTE